VTIKRIAFVVLAMMISLILMSGPSQSIVGPDIIVDGVAYDPTKIVGNGYDATVHYETPDTNPQAANTDRHVWVGHGSDNLPCEGGIHWIDNRNVLTISHCLEVPTTTTTPVPETTTSSSTTTTESPTTTTSSTTTTEAPTGSSTTLPTPEVTTTTIDQCIDTDGAGDCGTTTTEPEVPTTTSTVPPTPTTEPPTDPPVTELPFTGPGDVLMVIAAIGSALVAAGALLVKGTR